MLRALTIGTYYITVGLMIILRKRKRKFVNSFLNFLVYGIAEKIQNCNSIFYPEKYAFCITDHVTFILRVKWIIQRTITGFIISTNDTFVLYTVMSR
jgi:hypothetical protein